ncbi:hypothetical protein MKW94_024339 [Papaver nudicaule]|uniref:RING-type domain-containing protein n=1 Tax=Papaver nudicaule TaxID=74823 RepID=A0AA41VSL3_PAPNU|nr:hypothetical protein [Papaver nudicaule]
MEDPSISIEDLFTRLEDHGRRIRDLRRDLRREFEDIRIRIDDFGGSLANTRRAVEELDLIFNSLSNKELLEGLEGEDIKRHMKKIIVLDDSEVCSVCLQDMNGGDDGAVVALKCSHTFHEKCVLEWSKRMPNCPLCRHDMRKDQQQNLKRKRISHDDKEVMPLETSTTPRRRLRKTFEI